MVHDTLPDTIDNHCLQFGQIVGGILTGALLSAIIVWHAIS